MRPTSPTCSQNRARVAFPGGSHVALTHWSAGGDVSDPSKQQGVWQYCGKASGAAVKSFMKEYPYTDSPEPQGA